MPSRPTVDFSSAVAAQSARGRCSVRSIASDCHCPRGFIARLSGGFYIFGLPQRLDRSAIVQLARNTRSEGMEIFRDVGIVVQVQRQNTPTMVSDDLLVKFKPEVTEQQIHEFNQKNAVEIVRPEPFVKNQFTLHVISVSGADALSLARRYQESGLVSFAQPNFWRMYERNETIPNDPSFAAQWHLRNTGASGGAVGADARVSFAWDFTQGSSSVIIAIADNTFDTAHEDLSANLYTNPGEIAGNGADDDHNGFIDDVHGWNFLDNNNNNVQPVGAGDNHRTAVTGVAVASDNNMLGGSGACPGCRYMPLVMFNNCAVGGLSCVSSDAAFAGAINYAGAPFRAIPRTPASGIRSACRRSPVWRIHRNYVNLPTPMADTFQDRFFVRNPRNEPIRAVLQVQMPRGWRLAFDKLGVDKVFSLKPQQQILVRAKLVAPKGTPRTGEVTITQVDVGRERRQVMGGLTLRFGVKKTKAVSTPRVGAVALN